ncbi:MAG: class B sortase [Bacilli bacterium]|nr:class B sortase [Bacilli bacterium]
MKLKKSVKRGLLKFILFIITIVLLIILGLSIYKIVFWLTENKRNNNIKEMINQYIFIDNINEGNNNINFSKLKEINSDVIAYLKVANTKIDYPVVKGADNDFYLNHSFDRSVNSAGWIFVNFNNTFDGEDKNISMFGHGRMDGSMFGSLKETLTSNWQKNNPHKQILFITENEISEYEVFSTYKILIEDYYIKNIFPNSDEYEEFLNILKKRSNYEYDVELSAEDQIITLSTCDVNNHYRIVLHAKKVTN